MNRNLEIGDKVSFDRTDVAFDIDNWTSEVYTCTEVSKGYATFEAPSGRILHTHVNYSFEKL
jgi:hypothetical protein